MPLVRIAVQLGICPRHAILHTAPLLAGVVATEKSARGRNVVAFLAPRIVFYVMHVHVGNSLASVLPGLTPVAAKQNTAMLEQDEKEILIVRVNEDMAH